MNVYNLREYIIKPALMSVGMYSKSAENLLVGTAAQESHIGKYLYQTNGKAVGIYQIEPKTHHDILINFVAYRPKLQAALDSWSIGENPDEFLLGSIHYQTLIARFKYYQVKAPLPKHNDINGMANYWKTYYNTYLGKGDPLQFVANHEFYVGKQ